ncbi:MAG: type I phosphomannose isomerase catalytic subunit [Pirellulales bacterium]
MLDQPLSFRPLLKEYVWGGRRLGTLLGKPLGDGDRYAESWEIVDRGADQSVVADGLWMGTTLHELVEEQGAELLGRHHPQRQFPLLLKFLDAQLTLSVQVHPNDEQGALLTPPDLGKTEAWVVLAAEPGSKIYAGLKPGVDRAQLEQALSAGKCDECLHQLEPQIGDCIFLEAGTVHALGDGLVIAEIQQASNTTFRLFDWNRLDRDGKPRPLHIRESLDTIDFARGPVAPQVPEPTDRPQVERLVACDKFILERWRFNVPRKCGGDNRCHLVAVLEGVIDVAGRKLSQGHSLLIPAACQNGVLAPQGSAVLLDMYLP